MQFDWQAVAAPAIVLAAAAYLVRAIVLKWFRKSKGGCGSCGSCPSGATAEHDEPNLVQIGTMQIGTTHVGTVPPTGRATSSNGR